MLRPGKKQTIWNLILVSNADYIPGRSRCVCALWVLTLMRSADTVARSPVPPSAAASVTVAGLLVRVVGLYEYLFGSVEVTARVVRPLASRGGKETPFL